MIVKFAMNPNDALGGRGLKKGSRFRINGPSDKVVVRCVPYIKLYCFVDLNEFYQFEPRKGIYGLIGGSGSGLLSSSSILTSLPYFW